MKTVLLYYCAFVIVHALPPVLAADERIREGMFLQPHQWIFLGMLIAAPVVARTRLAFNGRALLVAMGAILAAIAGLGFDNPLLRMTLLCASGAASAFLVRVCYELCAAPGVAAIDVGKMLGTSSIILEVTSFSCGVVASWGSPVVTLCVLAAPALVVTALLLTQGASNWVPPPRETDSHFDLVSVTRTAGAVLPAVCANGAFLIYLAQLGEWARAAGTIAVGGGVALLAVGFPTGAWLSASVRKQFGLNHGTVLYAAVGLGVAIFATAALVPVAPWSISLYALLISFSNGGVISLATQPSEHEVEGVSQPADKALVFLMGAGVASLVTDTMVKVNVMPNNWFGIAILYLAATTFPLVRARRYALSGDL